MTGDDHDTDALIAALRSPALGHEHRGEAAAVTAMVATIASVPGATTRRRRAAAIAAVTVASLGVGGLVAAGHGSFLSPAADRPPGLAAPDVDADGLADATPRPASAGSEHAGGDPGTSPSVAAADSAVDARHEPSAPGDTAPLGVPRIACDDLDVTDEDAGDGTHGTFVADAAQGDAPGPGTGPGAADAARADCGMPDDAAAPGLTERHGDTPGTTAPGRSGELPAPAAPGAATDGPTLPAQAASTPATTAPGVGAPPSSTPAPTPQPPGGTDPDAPGDGDRH